MPPIGNVTCLPNNVTTEDSSNIGKDDLNALLYIVVTLLFYSMGIIIGIITYLKREQADMEEDKMFDMYMQLKREPFNLYKKERVQQMALYLKQVEERTAAREKIENWRTMEHSQMQAHLQRYQPCRKHAHRQFSCPDCNRTSPIAEICVGYDERAPLDAGWAENGGGTALLCSLTLGVCEPLLTPDSTKRFAVTELTNLENKPLNIPTHGAPIPQPYPCVPIKTAFRHNSLAVYTTDKEQNLLKDHCSPNNLKQTNIQAHSSESTPHNSPSMFDMCDMELKELRQFNYDEIKAVFQKYPAVDDHIKLDACGNFPTNTQIVASPKSGSPSLTTKTGVKSSTLFGQISQDRDLTIHSSVGNRCSLPKDTNNENLAIYADKHSDNGDTTADMQIYSIAKDTPCDNLLHSDRSDTCVCDGALQPRVDSIECSFQDQRLNQPYQQQEASQTIATEPAASSQICELPLHLYVPAQQPTQINDFRFQVLFPVTTIPHQIINDESINSYTNSITTSPQIYNVVSDSYNPGHSTKNVDISGVTRARQLGLNWKSKTAEKKGAPRMQPERRGALFFTQRSLHKDLDSPKAVGGRKSSRPGVFSRQESFDSHNSRSSEASDCLDNALLHHVGNIDNTINLSSPSLSIGSNSMSPPSNSKHIKRIPRLIRSQTVDTSKLLNQSNPF